MAGEDSMKIVSGRVHRDPECFFDPQCWYCGTEHACFTPCPEGTPDIVLEDEEGQRWRARTPAEGMRGDDAILGGLSGHGPFVHRVGVQPQERDVGAADGSEVDG